MSLESMTGMEFMASHLKFKVIGFKEKADGHVYYNINVVFTLKEPVQQQDLSYTYQHCLNFSNALATQCPNIPILSQVSIFGFKPQALEIERRKIELAKWLSAIVWRQDVIGTREFQDFCNINNLLQEKWLDSPLPSLVLSEGHTFPVSDFHYEPDTQVCFVATCDESLTSKVQGFMNIFTGGGKQITGGPLRSQLICYRLDIDEYGDPHGTQLWRTSYPKKGQVQASKILWDEQLTILAIGFDNGSILVLRVKVEKKYKEYSEFCTIIKHLDQITGMAANYQTGQLYSIAKDKCLITTDLSNPNDVLKEKEFPHELTCMMQHKDDKRLFIGDAVGSVYIFHYNQGNLQPAYQIEPNNKITISSIQICTKRNFLICGSKEGTGLVFELGKPGKERLTSLISQVETVPNQKYLFFSLSTKELYVNFNNNVLIVDSAKMKNLYSLGAHSQPITKMALYEDIGLLITSSKDGTLKVIYFWQFKFFTHSQVELAMIPYRGIQKDKKVVQLNEESKQVEKVEKPRVLPKPQLEDLDDWTQ